LLRDEPGGWSVFWPGGVRRRGGASPDCGVRVEQEKACCDAVHGSAAVGDTVYSRLRNALADRPVVAVKPW
jgi:hypothetical protein